MSEKGSTDSVQQFNAGVNQPTNNRNSMFWKNRTDDNRRIMSYFGAFRHSISIGVCVDGSVKDVLQMIVQSNKLTYNLYYESFSSGSEVSAISFVWFVSLGESASVFLFLAG